MEPIWRDETLVESWLPIEGFEEYQVSDFGRVKGQGGKILKPVFLKIKGYLRVSLSNNGAVKNKLIHRLVALAFLPNPENKPEVNHLNEIKHDNCLENLDWETKSGQKVWSPNPVGSSGERNININKGGTYRVYIRRNRKIEFDKSFAFLEDARKARDEFLKSL